MPEWLVDAVQHPPEQPPAQVAIQLATAFALGCVVAGIYYLSQRRENRHPGSMLATLVLLSILIAMVTLVIGNSVARAFSLVGALAIVRFRTIVEDTRDTAFVIFAVVVGMASGAGYVVIALIGIPIVAIASFLFRSSANILIGPEWNGTLEVRVGLGHSPELTCQDVFAKHIEAYHLQTLATARQGAAFDCRFQIRLRQGHNAADLVAELNQTAGVQNVEWKLG